ncbi:MAG: NHL repeat-containing protein [Phycisphaerales bacterium]|jgi:hypothetical protein
MKAQSGTANIKIFVAIIIALSIVVAIIALLKLDTTGQKGSGLGPEYVYEVDTKIDPNLILYEESAPLISTGLNSSHSIALDSKGDIYVVGDHVVLVFDDKGDLLNKIELTDMPRCLTVTDDDRIYIGMKDHVEIYDDQGKRLATWQTLGKNALLTSIAVYKNNVFVADAGNRIVLRYDTSGRLVNRIGEKDDERNIPGFVIPTPYFDLTVAPDGLLRVINPGRHRIEAYTFNGDLEFWWGEFSSSVEGFCGCCNPVNFVILEDESFVTCEKGLKRVKIYDPEGTFVGVVATPEQLGGPARICVLPEECQTGGFDLAVDDKGRIFILDTVKNVVRIFSKKKAG